MGAVIAGPATYIGINVLLALAYGIACGVSQFMNMLLRFSYLAWPIKMAGWFVAAWAGMSVWGAAQ